ncbi:InlB B-repeat-containing protein, partial [Candidatus Saccharibacteria bacterium]|nr:InlB B-repeat-containing protein [Candidatus Saccharibacteria bacterium]
ASEGVVIATTNAEDPKTNTHDLTFGAKTDTTTPAGTYEQTFTISAVANAAAYQINYNKNTEETVNNFPSNTETTLSGLDVILSNKIPTRTNFNFYGWNTEADGSGDSYAAGESISIDPEVDNNIILYAQWKTSKLTIVYDANNIDPDNTPTEGSMESVRHTGVKEGSTINLIASNYSRPGFGFVGWSPVASTNPNEEGAVVYGPNATITLPAGFSEYDTDNDGIIKLYAIWLEAEKDTNNKPIYFQGWISCSNLSVGDVTALTDSRDGSVYAIAKLADGNCWMIENLKLDPAGRTLDSINTNHPTADFLSNIPTTAAGGSTFATCLVNSKDCYDQFSLGLGNLDRSNTASAYANNQTSQWYSYGGMYNWYTATAGHGTYNVKSSSAVLDGDICPSGWHLPSGYNASGDFGMLDVNMGGTGSYQSTTAASGRWRAYPNNFLYSGYYTGSSTDARGISGSYWSSTSYSSNSSAYHLYFSNSSVYPGTYYYNRLAGYAIRCLAKDPETFTLAYDANGGNTTSVPQAQNVDANGVYTFTLSSTVPTRSGYTFSGWIDESGVEISASAIVSGTASYIATSTNTTLYAMWTNDSCHPSATTITTGTPGDTDAVCLQDMNSTVKSAMTAKDTYNLIDARDNKSYTVSLLDDGEVWMTQNLNFGGDSSTLISSHDSDLLSGYTAVIPASTSSFETTNNVAAYTSKKLYTDAAYGTYYSYATAIADARDHSTSAENITTSICPSGWDLPTRTQFNNLRTTAAYDTTTAFAVPYSFYKAGYKNGTNSPTNTTSVYLWTSTNSSQGVAYYSLATANATTMSYNKRFGMPIRCIAGNGVTTIHYDANGGSGSMNDQANVEINAATANYNTFIAPDDHKKFRNWNTKADGTGATVTAGGSITAAARAEGVASGGTLTLYAQWDDIHIMTFVNTNGNAERTKTVVQGSATTVAPTSSFSRTGYKLIGWDTVTNNADGSTGTVVYTNGQNVTPTEDMTFYTVWRPVYTVVYNANGGRCELSGDTITTTCMANVKHTNVAEGDTFDLFASNYSRENYGFAGWSINPEAVVNGTDIIYGPNETIGATNTFIASHDANNIITLYAVWVSAETITINGVTSPLYLQDFDSTVAPYSAYANDTVIALTDKRDNDVYAVAKLADNNWWMIENLRLGSTAITPLTAVDTDILSDYSLPASTSSFSTSPVAYQINTLNKTSRGTNPTITNNVSSANSHANLDARIYSYGNYYSWSAVTSVSSSSGQDVYDPTSICPRGWRLPTGAGNGDFANLDRAMGGLGRTQTSNYEAAQRWRAFPVNYVYSGTFGNQSDVKGSAGYYWSVTIDTGSLSYDTGVTPKGIYPGSGTNYKYIGLSARCVAN